MLFDGEPFCPERLLRTALSVPPPKPSPLSRPRRPLLVEHEVRSVRVSQTHDGLRIAHISDVHVRTGFRPRHLERAVELVNAIAPDFVALTGDYVCRSKRPVHALTAALRHLEAPAFATLGNHDHWSCATSVRRALSAAGIDVLTNEHRRLETARGLVHVVGVDDSVTRHHDPEAAFAGVPSSATTIVLSHDPVSADFLHPFQPTLILSGHTHGGQIFLERVTPYLMKRFGHARYLEGMFEVEGARLFVNRGLGATVPIRFRMPSEVALLTLRTQVAAMGAAAAA